MVSPVLRRLLERSERYNESVLNRTIGKHPIKTPLIFGKGTTSTSYRITRRRKHNLYTGVPVSIDKTRIMIPLSEKGHELVKWLDGKASKPNWLADDGKIDFYLKKPISGYLSLEGLKDYGRKRLQLKRKRPEEDKEDSEKLIMDALEGLSKDHLEGVKRILEEISEDLVLKGSKEDDLRRVYERRANEVSKLTEMINTLTPGEEVPTDEDKFHIISEISTFVERHPIKSIYVDVKRHETPELLTSALKDAGDHTDIVMEVEEQKKSKVRSFVFDRGLNMESIIKNIRSHEEAEEIGKAYADVVATGIKYGLRFGISPINFVMNDDGRIIPIDEFDFAVSPGAKPRDMLSFIELMLPTYEGNENPNLIKDINAAGLKKPFHFSQKVSKFFDILKEKPEILRTAEKSFLSSLKMKMDNVLKQEEEKKAMLEKHIEKRLK